MLSSTVTVEERLARVEHDLQELHAQSAIRRTLSQYAIAVDEKRREWLRELFATDASLRIPVWNIDVSGKAAVMAFYEDYWRRFDNPRRYYANEDIAVRGNDATAFMYWHVTQERNGQSIIGWGTYEWSFRRHEARWQIASVVINLQAMTTLAAGWAGAARFTDP